MKEKLRDLLESEGLKPGQFTEMVGINPAGVSHLLAGRNKPGFELLQKILRRFPRVSPDWLLIDEGPMYRTDERNDFSTATAEPAPFQEPAPTATPTSTNLFETPSAPTAAQQKEIATMGQHSGREVARVIVCYTDHTFESFTPSAKI